jgi:hypothetical protein
MKRGAPIRGEGSAARRQTDAAENGAFFARVIAQQGGSLIVDGAAGGRETGLQVAVRWGLYAVVDALEAAADVVKAAVVMVVVMETKNDLVGKVGTGKSCNATARELSATDTHN